MKTDKQGRIPIVVKFPQDDFDAVEEWRGNKSPIPDRMSAILDLIRSGLRTEKAQA